MNCYALAQLAAGNAMDVMRAKPARFPEPTFDVRRELTFNDAVSTHHNDAKLEY